ncbi:type II toxin-antitoxin system mRNA interferase toxin, RelE/StbE family [Candidatus Gracilibacteria bacterium]|nr:type II toxin-antitoxin system mRNA interferase toxin, RelE/StbE family [Candidatus Gracilibacteria bacterium]
MIKKIRYSSRFIRSYKKLPISTQNIIKGKLKVLSQDTFAPSLKTHKLKGRLYPCYSFSVQKDMRVIFRITKTGEIHLANIGTHDEVY